MCITSRWPVRISPAFRDDAGVSPAFRDGAGASPVSRDGAGASPAFRDGAGASPAFRDGAGVSPAFRDDAGVSPAFRDDAGARDCGLTHSLPQGKGRTEMGLAGCKIVPPVSSSHPLFTLLLSAHQHKKPVSSVVRLFSQKMHVLQVSVAFVVQR